MMFDNRERIAVIGAGVAGVVASHILQEKYSVTLFEKNSSIGGHTNTVVLESGPDAGTAVDTGFIVLNNKTYPLFHGFLASLDVPVRWSEMSFSFFCERTNFTYAGSGLNGLFAERKNLFQSDFYRMLFDIARFCKEGSKRLLQGNFSGMTLGEFLRDAKIGPLAVDCYVLPMGAAIWSTPVREILDFPAESFARFFQNHGLLSFKDRPQWQTVVGGSHAYLKKFREQFTGTIVENARIENVVRDGNGITVSFRDGRRQEFSKVVLATHADQALNLLADPTPEERSALGVWSYQKNKTVLHTDASVLPPLKRAWASWNSVREARDNAQEQVSVSYNMNILQGLKTAKTYCVSLNRIGPIDEKSVIAEFLYEHPTYTQAAIDSQSKLLNLNGKNNTFFCGSYFGYGFHEDAVRSAYGVAERLLGASA